MMATSFYLQLIRSRGLPETEAPILDIFSPVLSFIAQAAPKKAANELDGLCLPISAI